jgi:hypothetical protein
MRTPYTTTEILNCVFYVVFLIALAVGIQFFIEWMLNNAAFPAINWFNKLALFWKLLIVFFGATTLIYLLASAVGLIHGLFVLFIFKNLPRNSIVNWFAIIIFYLNVIICVKAVYSAMPSWKLWFIIEFLALCLFCIAANYSILYTVNRDKKLDKQAYLMSRG